MGNVLSSAHIFRPFTSLKVEADHRIANNLSVLNSLIWMQAKRVAQRGSGYRADEVCALLSEISARVETIANLHKLLAGNAEGDEVNVGEFVRRTCSALGSLSTSSGLLLSMRGGCEHRVHARQALSIGLITAELITNAVKYAHPTGIPVRVEVVCRASPEGLITIEVADDGVGLPEGFDASAGGGLGFQLMRSLADELDAELSFESGCLGTRGRLVLQGNPARGAGGV
jgi:two-component sensor histidine kinase